MGSICDEKNKHISGNYIPCKYYAEENEFNSIVVLVQTVRC
jgi:hypothetical protein